MPKISKILFAGLCLGTLGSVWALTPSELGGGVKDSTVYGSDRLIEIGEYYPWIKIGIPQEIEIADSLANENGHFVYRSAADSLVAVILDADARTLTLEGLAYKSVCELFLDSASGIWSKDSACPHDWDLKAVFLSEFSHLQSVGVLKISAEAADSLALHIVAKMEAALSGGDFEFLVYHPAEGASTDTAFVEKKTLASAAPLLTTKILSAVKSGGLGKVQAATLGAGFFRISGAKPRTKFSLYSANGALLNRGFLPGDGKIFAQTLPAILRLRSGETLLLK